ncbi:GTPase IMAP family member 7-like [Nothobranchius furzeri]|uniref:GTPase IMAP family member 7-like n=1 Tax=Nothobranchius furzeri TaxID=105023 RepID=A0A9D2Y8A7_NOTFU|nr:GTPase IMAP family member 7-like [Nothobranchius furzeri]
MDELTTFRIVLLGKSRNGKSSLANVLFGETKFKVKNLNDSNTVTSDARTKCIKGRNLTLIDTPGFLDPGRTEKEVKPELTRCVAECAPGPHVFLIVLKVEKHTEHEKAVINNIREYFSGDALKYAVVVFTHGDQLPEGMKIEEFVDQSEELKELVEKCGGRCHVFDCKYWKNNDQEDAYRSNQLQMAELLNTIDKILMENTGGYYTNTILRDMEREIQEEERSIQETSQKMSKEEIRELAKSNVVRKQLKAASRWIKGLVAAGVIVVSAVWIGSRSEPTLTEVPVPLLDPVNQGMMTIGEAILTSAKEAGEQMPPIAVSSMQLPVRVVQEAAEAGIENIAEHLFRFQEQLFTSFNPFE